MLLTCAGLPCIGRTAAGCGRISWRLPRRARRRVACTTDFYFHAQAGLYGTEDGGSNEGSQSGEGQTGVGKRNYIVRRSFFRCSEVSVVDVCACTIKSPISRIFDGRFRKAVRMTDQDDTVKVESWRTLQLDIQVRCLSHILSPCARLDVLVTTYLQTLPTA
jgi:hypothetical protein